MGVGSLPRIWWRLFAVPLAVWLLLTACGTAGLLWAQHRSRAAVAERFDMRLDLLRDFVSSYVADLIDREREQAETFLADPAVGQRDFERSVAGFGYPAAVLLDGRGRLLRAVPADPTQLGRDLTGRYAHLDIAVRQDRPAVSPVVSSAVRGEPVVAFAVPYTTDSGRRVFSGAVAITRSPLTAYLSSAWTSPDIRVQLVDTAGVIAASNRPVDRSAPALTAADQPLAAALAREDHGRYQVDGRWWRYASVAVPGVPWRLSATVPEQVLFTTIRGNEIAGRVAVATASGVGLLVVVAAGRARRSRREMQASETRFRRVFDNSQIGMFITDAGGWFVRVNPAFVRMLGRTPDSLAGAHFAEITHPDDAKACMGMLSDCVSGRIDHFETEKRYRHADGSLVEVIVTSALLRDATGRPQYFATQILDVTERRTLERARARQQVELSERAAQLQRANVQMADFIAMLSHDVRQPLTSVVAGGELLLEEWPELSDDARSGYVRKMTSAGRRAEHLVDEILTLAQLDAGAIVAHPVRLDLSHTVRQVVAAIGGTSGQLITVLAPDQSMALADPAHLQLIFGNLLGNALKYGAPPVVVTVTNRLHQVDIKITDHGEGVPAVFVPHLFDRFTRAETGVAITKPGTGLGLYLVRQLAEAGGIAVAYQPHHPHGSTFVLTVPCPSPAAAVPRPQGSVAPTR
ncbi:hypothetical protein GCM10010172_68040 [Paractinoplanes ferrugineus]|uniref:Sensor-like histidine kinase SenX3 n=1 Tax=Paractinoplanes ferrugineus TaxID=113564 RepID=A0A919JAZ4_9ACTN|nr:sensor histidine kinase [Actinoplanes ferrugineus]GIE16542.1 hypothetical protein Afe05nite_83820 [Actinoplanes ferrugineus]